MLTCPVFDERRQPEEVSVSTVETVEPVFEQQPGSSGNQGVLHGNQVVPVEVGRLFDEFFEFASEVEKGLSVSGGQQA